MRLDGNIVPRLSISWQWPWNDPIKRFYFFVSNFTYLYRNVQQQKYNDNNTLCVRARTHTHWMFNKKKIIDPFLRFVQLWIVTVLRKVNNIQFLELLYPQFSFTIVFECNVLSNHSRSVANTTTTTTMIMIMMIMIIIIIIITLSKVYYV